MKTFQKIQEQEVENQKSIFSLIFIFAALILVTLPFTTTFNEALTKIVQQSHLYMSVQQYIVPAEIKIIGALLKPFGVSYLAHANGMTVNNQYMELTWNCIGWQSLALLLVTFLVGLQGNWSRISKLECVTFGILGTFMINLLRITITVVLAAFSGQLFAIVFHDYFAAFVTIVWLMFFWWFSYAFILQPKEIQNSKCKSQNYNSKFKSIKNFLRR